MLARGLLCRLAADTPTIGTKTPTHGFSQLARLLQPNIASRNGLTRAYRTAYVQYRRSYATAAAAVKKPAARKPAATKPTATVKRAVKATAAAKKAPATRKVAAKKPASKKKAAAKTPAAKKPAAKKPAAKRKPAAKKPAAKRTRKVKKVLTPEEEFKLKTRTLKKVALRDPPHVASSAWQAFVAEVVKGSDGPASAAVASAGPKFKALSPAEKEHYNHLANEATVAKKAAYKTWIASHTPEEIRAANRARAALRRRHKENGGKGYPAHTTKIQDERAVKKVITPYLQFSLERRASGDFKAIALGDSSKLIGQEWKALSEAEKQKYRDAYQADKAAA